MAIQGFELGAQDLQCFQTGVTRPKPMKASESTVLTYRTGLMLKQEC